MTFEMSIFMKLEKSDGHTHTHVLTHSNSGSLMRVFIIHTKRIKIIKKLLGVSPSPRQSLINTSTEYEMLNPPPFIAFIKAQT